MPGTPLERPPNISKTSTVEELRYLQRAAFDDVQTESVADDLDARAWAASVLKDVAGQLACAGRRRRLGSA